MLRRHPWPGNVRELRNVIQRAAVLCVGQAIKPEHLPLSLLGSSSPRAPAADAPAPPNRGLSEEIRALERARIVEALHRCAGNQSRAAELLGISRRTLTSRLAEFGLPRPRKPSPD